MASCIGVALVPQYTMPNRDGQLRTLLINELEPDPAKLASIRYYGGLSISAEHIVAQVSEHFTRNKLPRLNEVAR